MELLKGGSEHDNQYCEMGDGAGARQSRPCSGKGRSSAQLSDNHIRLHFDLRCGLSLIPTNPFVYGFNGTVNSSGNASGIWATNTPPSFTQARLQIDMKSVVVSTWKTHGDYVAFSGETANDAAHSCIGMPVQSNN